MSKKEEIRKKDISKVSFEEEDYLELSDEFMKLLEQSRKDVLNGKTVKI